MLADWVVFTDLVVTNWVMVLMMALVLIGVVLDSELLMGYWTAVSGLYTLLKIYMSQNIIPTAYLSTYRI